MLAAPYPAEPNLDAAGLIGVWEDAITEAPPARAVMLLARAWPGHDWSRTPIGIRDRWLLRLRERLFGPAMPAIATCPACAATLELELMTTDLIADAPEPPAEGLSLVQDDVTVRYRLPDTLDLLTAAAAPVDIRAAVLLDRCVIKVTRAGAPIPLPPTLRGAIAAGMAEADPQADPRLALACPGCGHEWTAPFDIAAYLWEDIEDCAHRLLRQVHDIARAYGWTEDTILRLSARRRRMYLEAITGTA